MTNFLLCHYHSVPRNYCECSVKFVLPGFQLLPSIDSYKSVETNVYVLPSNNGFMQCIQFVDVMLMILSRDRMTTDGFWLDVLIYWAL
jgi:hypothetical protein